MYFVIKWGGGGGYRIVCDMTGIESSDFKIDKFITSVKSCQVSELYNLYAMT